MAPDDLYIWFSRDQQRSLADRLTHRVGVTRTRADCFVRLWVYLLVKYYQDHLPHLKPPLGELESLPESIVCTHREAAEVFYGDREQGSDRAAGIMLDKLAALGLIQKTFDGSTTRILINPLAEVPERPHAAAIADLKIDCFDPRCDAVPIANLLATNYNWMNRNNEAAPQRISRLLRQWADEYATGMRVLRRCDNFHPVGFYLLYPTASESEFNFFDSPSKSLHLSSLSAIDPFKLAKPGDANCLCVFVRSWMIDVPYLQTYRIPFVEDVQQTLIQMQQDFPNLCDLYTLLIHPNYETLAQAVGFQKTGKATQSICWMYLAIDRFLTLDIKTALAHL